MQWLILGKDGIVHPLLVDAAADLGGRRLSPLPVYAVADLGDCVVTPPGRCSGWLLTGTERSLLPRRMRWLIQGGAQRGGEAVDPLPVDAKLI